MCDACRNKAVEFERSLTPEQREGFERFLQVRKEDENRESFDLGYDEARKEDGALYESAVSILDDIRNEWERLLSILNPPTEGSNLAQHIATITERFEKFPRDLRDV